jgi:hypothetical protein
MGISSSVERGYYRNSIGILEEYYRITTGLLRSLELS